MNNEDIERLQELQREDFIWITFIIIGLFSIYGDKLLKESIICNQKNKEEKARSIFLITITITLVIYFYFLKRNYNDYLKHNCNEVYKIRLLGSIFVIAGTICFIYFIVNSPMVEDTPSI